MQHDPIRLPRAMRRPWLALLTAVLNMTGGRAELIRHSEQPWASATFAGSRHTVVLAFTGAEAIDIGEAFLALLPDHEFTIPRQIVADASVARVIHSIMPEERLECEIELLLLDDV